MVRGRKGVRKAGAFLIIMAPSISTMIISGLLFLAVILFWQNRALGEINSCTNCHSGLQKGLRERKAFNDWQGSVHARAGIACDACHGGDRAASLYADAHRGILDPSDPRSPTHANNIPELCGGCHGLQLKEFQASRHFLVLRADEREIRGPNCVTCHGAMHTRILSPEGIADKCRLCHNQKSGVLPNIPGEAHATLALIFYARTTLQWSEEFIAAAREQGHDVSEAANALKEAKVMFRYSKIKWHSFNFPEILRMVDGTYEAAKRAKELAAREVKTGGTEK